jgi:hypothetical protein
VTFAVVNAMLLKIKILWTALRPALLDLDKGRHCEPSEGQQLHTSKFGITLQKTRKINECVSLNFVASGRNQTGNYSIPSTVLV